ncbi:hypothetical protein BU23DRAFT_15124 [Bimuria novae-zelandiae CBS 107.79]|uniref:AA1-like domain-containing protein n=1 Tax=Bimuria novae-zelandiae CBS 107.79 TaxID=1447943 RepID=A0A6A5VKD3_9PLEO|nr:hypothetical protein BU23DRAFT_15124 [Bimuria novae-zelandiae CBS 107.79]
MHFASLAVLGLAALSSAAAVPRSALGSWYVSIKQESAAIGWRRNQATAVYTSDSYPEGITSTCVYELLPGRDPLETQSCDGGFSYMYDGQTVSLQQVVQKPSPNTTVFGSALLKLTPNAIGRSWTGNTTVEVTAATA